MTIIKNILIKIKELTKNILTLRAQLRLMETRLNNIDSKAQTPNYDISSPILTKTLDTNNIWMGEKGVNSYTNMAKLDVIYDSVDELWRPFQCINGAVPTPDADKEVTLIWDSSNKKYIVYKNPPYAIYYPG